MQTDFLKYDASSIQELLRRKLLESGLYTDQIYPGSDTRILIDLFAWTFDVLTYILNSNAADTLFEDTEVYENLNKIVKLLSYSPKSFITSNCEFSISCNLDDNNGETYCTIPRFSYIDTGKHDSKGNPIKYSFVDLVFHFNISSLCQKSQQTFNMTSFIIVFNKNKLKTTIIFYVLFASEYSTIAGRFVSSTKYFFNLAEDLLPIK